MTSGQLNVVLSVAAASEASVGPGQGPEAGGLHPWDAAHGAIQNTAVRGVRTQHFPRRIGITESYLYQNTFVCPLNGQYDEAKLRWLAQDSGLARRPTPPGDRQSRARTKRSAPCGGCGGSGEGELRHLGQVPRRPVPGGGTRPAGATARPSGRRCGSSGCATPEEQARGARRPRSSRTSRRPSAESRHGPRPTPRGFRRTPGPSALPAASYKYRSAPIPLRDLPYGVPVARRAGRHLEQPEGRSALDPGVLGSGEVRGLRLVLLGRGRDERRLCPGAWRRALRAPKKSFSDFDRGPDASLARLFMGGAPRLGGPTSPRSACAPHPSFGCGPIYRGRPGAARILVLADQESNDDLFTGRALTGDAGQRFQEFLRAMGITRSYLILRVLPVDTADLSAAKTDTIVDHAKVHALYEAMVQQVVASASPAVVLTMGSHANRLADQVLPTGLHRVRLKAWGQGGALADWQNALDGLKSVSFTKDVSSPSFLYDGRRGQIPRIDLPYGTLRWQGSSGNRAVRGTSGGQPSSDYYKVFMPDWAFGLARSRSPRRSSRRSRRHRERGPTHEGEGRLPMIPHASGRLIVVLADTAGLEATSAGARPAGPRLRPLVPDLPLEGARPEMPGRRLSSSGPRSTRSATAPVGCRPRGREERRGPRVGGSDRVRRAQPRAELPLPAPPRRGPGRDA